VNLSRAAAILLIFVFTFCVAVKPARSDNAFLYGRVELQGHAIASKSDHYYVQVCAEYEKPQNLPVSKQNTKWDLYSCRVPVGPVRVRLRFVADDYQPLCTDGYINIDKPSDIPIFPPVQMHRVIPKKAYASSAELLEGLKQQSIAFNLTKSYDVFQQNLASLRYAYRNNPDLSGAIQQFQTASTAQPFMAPQFFNRQALYFDIIRRANGENVSISQSSLMTLMKDENAFPGIRANAIKALAADEALKPQIKTEFLDYLRVQSANSSALLFRPARSGLAKIGSPEDKRDVLNDVSRKDDPERVLAALIAVRNSRLDDSSTNPETAPAAKSALSEWAKMPEAPPPSRVKYIWSGGVLAPDLDMKTFTSGNIPNWYQVAQDGDDTVLRLDYPANQEYGVLQIMVHQTSTTPRTQDFSNYAELVVELKSADPDRNVDIGIKGAKDPDAQTKFKRTFSDVSTDWQEYHIPLQGEAAQLSARAATNQVERLQNLKIVTELAFGAKDRQVFYIRKIYFADP